MRDQIFRDTRSSRRRSPPHRYFRDEARRPGSRGLEPERSRVVSPVRRTERKRDHQPDRSNEIDIARYGESVARGVETASSKFQWRNLLDAKQVQNATSTAQNNAVNGFRYGIVTETHVFSGSGNVGPIGPSRSSYGRISGGFVSPLKEIHQQQQNVEYGVSILKPNAPSTTTTSSSLSSFGGPLGLCRSIGIGGGADGYFAEHVHGHVAKPKYCTNNRDELKYSEVQKSEKSDGVVLCSKFLPPEFQRPSIVDSIVEKIDGALLGSHHHGHPFGKGALWEEEEVEEEEHFVAPPKCIVDVTQEPSKHCVEPLGCSRNVHPPPEYATDGYRESEGCWGLRGYEKDAYTSNYQGGWKGLPVLDHDRNIYKERGRNSVDGTMKAEELAMHDDLYDVEMVELKYDGYADDEKKIRRDFGTGLPHCHRQCVYDTFEDEGASFDDGMMHLRFDEQSNSPYSPVRGERSSRKLRKIVEKSMKKKKKKQRPARIIPRPSSSVASRRRINVHARLGPCVFPAEEPYNAAKYITNKKLKRNLCDFSRTPPCSDPSDVKLKVEHSKRSKTEPPEDSKEFKQLVQNAFLKFVKLLNENPSLRRKYVEQGRIETLRCTLCGSKSKEFANTHSLAMHAFNSTKAQHRAEHLGFHKALCVLLGWGDTAASDGLWVQQILPADEAANLRNDLIIWPPVVLIHNSSIAHLDPDKRVIVSIEGLEAILGGMGFVGGKTKVSRGKPANYSILVVNFNATFSGLQEAERLHKFYADNKHGRDEFKRIDGSGLKNSNEDTHCIPDNVESFLYGYLGYAGDLDKLDFESKKHCVVRSKKEIQAIADAPLRDDWLSSFL